MNRALFTIGCFALVAGCAVGPDYQTPDLKLPEHWHEAPIAEKSAAGGPGAWWKTFKDPILNRLIAEAVTSNLDLQQAAARIRDARAQQTMAIAAALPSVDSRSNLSRRSNNFASSTGSSGTSAGGFGIGNQIVNIFQAGFDAQWELDVFGGIRRGIEAADATIEAEVENRRDVLVSLLAEVARHYVELRGNQQLIAVTRENLRYTAGHPGTDTGALQRGPCRHARGLAAAGPGRSDGVAIAAV